MFEPENVFSSVYITVVNRTARSALPFSHSEAFQSFRTADASAVGTDLGRQPLTPLLVFDPVPSGFIAELTSQERPAGIEHGLCHPRLCQLGGIDVADNDAAIGAYKPCRLDVEVMSSSRGDLTVDCLGVALAAGALRSSDLGGAALKVPHVGNLTAVRTCDEVFESEVKPNSGAFSSARFVNLDLQGQEPSAACVASKAIPDVVDGPGERTQPLSAGGIFNAVSIGQKHGNSISQLPKKGAPPPRHKGRGFRCGISP